MKLGVCSSPRRPISAQYLSELGAHSVRSIIYSIDDLEYLIDTTPEDIDIILVLNNEMDLVKPDWSGWLTAIAHVAGTGRGRVKAAILGNELDRYWADGSIDTPEFGASLARDASGMLRNAGISPILSSVGGPKWQEWLGRAASLASDSIDGAAFHPYGQRPDNWRDVGWGHGDLRVALARAYELAKKPIWVTELGVKIGEAGGEQGQASYLGQGVSTCLASGVVPHVTYFAWHDEVGAPDERDDSAFGLMSPSHYRRPAWFTFTFTADSIAEVEPEPVVWNQTSLEKLSLKAADDAGIPQHVMLALGWAESDLKNASRPTNIAHAMEMWPDVSYGPWQQTVRWYQPYLDAGYGGAWPDFEVVRKYRDEMLNDPPKMAQYAAKLMRSHLAAELGHTRYKEATRDQILRALHRYNWPSGGGKPATAAVAERYDKHGLKKAEDTLGPWKPVVPAPPPATTLQEKLAAVISRGQLEVGKPYSGPIVGQPDSYRWGDPGWDCSSFVSGMYKEVLGVNLAAYTDAAYDQTVPVDMPLPGDIVFYSYPDPAQPGVRFPHMGLWLDEMRVLDARWPRGVQVNPHLATGVRKVRRAKALADAPSVPMDPRYAALEAEIARLREQVHGLTTALAYVCDDLFPTAAAKAKEVREQFIGPKP